MALYAALVGPVVSYGRHRLGEKDLTVRNFELRGAHGLVGRFLD
jgi:hypothetical protein